MNALSAGDAALILFGIFFGLMLLRVPVAFALGLACVPVYVIEPRLDAQGLVQETFNAYNSFILLAVPFFLLTANDVDIVGAVVYSGAAADNVLGKQSLFLVGVVHHNHGDVFDG